MSPWAFVAIGYLLAVAVWSGYLLAGRRRTRRTEGAPR